MRVNTVINLTIKEYFKREHILNIINTTMQAQTLNKTKNPVPFTLSLVEKLDESLYDEAIENSRILEESYNPETQTSDLSIYAGTSLTYEKSWSGFLGAGGLDDTEQTDT